jgi:hypothetical protein
MWTVREELGAELVGKGLSFGGLGALISRHIQRIAHHGLGDAVFADKSGSGFDVRASRGAVEGKKRLGGIA